MKSSLPLDSPQPASGIRFRGKRPQTEPEVIEKVEKKKEINLWEIISAQHDFNRTLWAPSHGGTFQWKTQRFNMPIKLGFLNCDDFLTLWC